MSLDSASRAEVAAETHRGAPDYSETAQGRRKSSGRMMNISEKSSGEASAWNEANELERSRDSVQHIDEGQASQWQPYRQKGNVLSLDLDAICMLWPPHQP